MSLLFISAVPTSSAAKQALESCAQALGHTAAPTFASLDTVDDVRLLVHQVDPWQVVALDEPSIGALHAAFPREAADLAPDNPIDVHGYELIAVPGFEECLADQQLKRVAWNRLKAAKYPTSPL